MGVPRAEAPGTGSSGFGVAAGGGSSRAGVSATQWCSGPPKGALAARDAAGVGRAGGGGAGVVATQWCAFWPVGVEGGPMAST